MMKSVSLKYSSESRAKAELLDSSRAYKSIRSPDPTRCHIVAWKKSSVILKTVDSSKQECQVPLSFITSQLVSEILNTVINCSVERTRECQFEISSQPIVKGRHQLHIKVKDKHIKGSPFSVANWSPVGHLGNPISTIDDVSFPDSVAIGSKGNVVVTEWGGHCVTVFSPRGEKLRSFGKQGSREGEFDLPCGVAVDRDDTILVADCNNHRIQKFTAKGKFLTAVGTQGKGPLQFGSPIGIAISTSSEGRVYIADKENGCVQILNSDLSYYSSFGRRGIAEGEFAEMMHLACDNTGCVYVADGGNNRVQVFTDEGEFLRVFERPHGVGGGEEVSHPWGVAVDITGTVYISERGRHCVSLLTYSTGEFLTSFGRHGEGEGKFQRPHGVAVDSSGVVYVCDFANNCVQIF